jgi:hypothetical protein
MRDTGLQRLADTLGWIAYLTVMGGGISHREVLSASAQARNKARDRVLRRSARVLRLEDHRERKTRRRRLATARSADAATFKVA